MSAFVAGLFAGLALAIPFGAVSAIILSMAAARGLRVGVAAGLGTATVDGLYAALAVSCGALLAPVVGRLETPLAVVSSGVLVVMGVWMLRPVFSHASASSDPGEPRPEIAVEARPVSASRGYLTVFGLTVVNPVTVVYFTALVVAGAPATGVDGVAFVLGVAIGSAVWQCLLALAGAVAGRAVTGPVGVRVTAGVGGGFVVVLGLLGVKRALVG